MSYSQKNSKGVEYFLNKKDVVLNNGVKTKAYYFSKNRIAETATELPENKIVVESNRSKILLLKNK